jgi:hypothetical protein
VEELIKEDIMNKKSLTTLILAAALASGSTLAMAQEGLHNAKKSDQAPPAAESTKGEASGTALGQGGTAGTHDTGSKPGPARIGDVKTPGN